MHAQTQTAPADTPAISDFNDLAASAGPERVRERIGAALALADTAAVTPPEDAGDAGAGAQAEAAQAAEDAQGRGAAGANAQPAGDAKDSGNGKKTRGRPKRTESGDSLYMLDGGGVWFLEPGEDEEPGIKRWICAPLEVAAKTRDAKNEGWGRLLHWRDSDGNAHAWAAPAYLLIGDGRDFARELVGRGLEIAPGSAAIRRLLAYVMTEPAEARARSLPSPGWFGRQYVLPTGEVFGTGQEPIVYQHSGGVAVPYGVAGDWKTKVGALCAGNSRLVFAVSAMFSGPLLRLVGLDGGGFHLVGDSSSGKSTALRVAASVAGEPSAYVREWRATANALEGVAVLHNDTTMILDEISQVDGQQAGEVVYMLANGAGKSRANRAGEARSVATWLVQTLSAGEVTLGQHMAQAGKQIRAGQMVRLADIPADAGAGYGGFESLHGAETADSFAVNLRMRCEENHGGSWREWLEFIAGKRAETLILQLRQSMDTFKRDAVPDKANGQVSRVAARFALASAAGELATAAGLTGWKPGEARRAALRCFGDWLQMRGGAENGEHIALLSQVRAFFEAHGESRFEPLYDETHRTVIHRAGFLRNDPTHGLQYLVMPETFARELCKGFNHRNAGKWLTSARWIVPGDATHKTQLLRVPKLGGSPMRFYVFKAAAVHGAEPANIPQEETCPF